MAVNKMQRFSQRARQVLTLSEQQAQKLAHTAIEPYHLLLAMMQTDNSAAQAALNRPGKLVYDDVLMMVESLVPGDPTAAFRRDLSMATKRLLERSVIQARQHRDRYIGSEHLLLALMDEPDDITLRVLTENELNPQTMIEQVERVLLEHEEQAGSIPALGEERMKVLQMVDDGKITPVEGTELLQSLQIMTVGVPAESQWAIIPRRGSAWFNGHLKLSVRDKETGNIKYEGRISVNQAVMEIQRLLQQLYAGATGKITSWEQGSDSIEISVEDDDPGE
jgi:hypothetical protein